MAGQLGEEVRAITDQFNLRQSNYVIKPIYKGNYIESLTSFAAAFRAQQPPNLIQVFEVGAPVMLFPKGVVKSAEQLAREQGINLPKKDFFTAVRNHYSDHDQLMAMPFNVSLPILFYNADVLKTIGISAINFPRTWIDLEFLLKKLNKAGYPCGYTTAYPAWVLIESYSALNGLNSDLAERREDVLTAHIKRMRRWQQHHYFEYGGRIDDATVLFTSGRCPLFSQSSGAFESLSQLVPFHLGVAPMPLDSEVSTVRHNNVVGGAAIWIVAGQTSETERGIVQFLSFLAEQNRQQSWYEHTGYLPLASTIRQGAHKERPSSILEIAALDLENNEEPFKDLQQVPKNQIRNINDEMLEAVFSGILSPEEGIKKAFSRIQQATSRFKKNTDPTPIIR